MLLNIERPMANQDINPNEPQHIQMWISSASDRNTYAYDKTIELMELAILSPHKVFIWGFDYKVPLKAGLLPLDFLNEIKMSATFSEEAFAKEYLSRFVGTSNESWFDFEKFENHRVLVNPETKEKVREGIESFYLIAVDVARRGCQSVAVVLKVFPKNEHWRCNVVNIYVIGKTEDEKTFDKQVLELKRLIKAFNPKEVIIDINGIGFPFGDEMIKETFDPLTNTMLPAYAFFNRKEYEEIQPRNAPKILYGIKATSNLNSDMHSTLFSKIYSGSINFLISEREAKEKILATRVGKKMRIEDRIARLMPHEMTTQLINEIMNLKVKPTGIENKIAVEQINKRMTKDKFSALEMGVYRMAELENEQVSRYRNRGLAPRKLTFYRTGGGSLSGR